MVKFKLWIYAPALAVVFVTVILLMCHVSPLVANSIGFFVMIGFIYPYYVLYMHNKYIKLSVEETLPTEEMADPTEWKPVNTEGEK